ncbi:lamin tail domain-containing protein [Phaeodactylibacter luteus]|nr:lamin tail domain-containing protein [Phaeodactylibacter luteus]
MRTPITLGLLCLALTSPAQSPGDFVISEYMANPAGAPDEQGEYIEVYNRTDFPLSLQGCTLHDGSATMVTIDEFVLVPGKSFAVLGRSAVPDAAFYFPSSPPPFNLNNFGGDQIQLICNGKIIAQTFYTNGQLEGVAMELTDVNSQAAGITVESAYQAATASFQYIGYAQDNLGSPAQSGNTMLPVALTAFSARAVAGEVALKWATATELNNDYFAIEHSTDGRAFSEIGRVQGQGTTQAPQAYYFSAPLPRPGLHFYRLRQADFDGQLAYYGPVQVQVAQSEPAQLSAYPTFATTQVHLQWGSPAPEGSTLLLTGLNGCINKQLTVPSGSKSMAFGLQGLPRGSYAAVLRTPDRQQAARFFIID